MNEFHRSFVSFSVVLFLLFIIFSEPLSWPSDGKQTYPAAFLLATGRTGPGANPHPRCQSTLGEHGMRAICTDVFLEAVARTTHFQREVNCNVN